MQVYIKKILGSGRRNSSSSASHNNTTLIVSNNEIEDLIKIVESLEDSGLLLKRITQTVQNEVKEQKAWFLSVLLGSLGVSLLGNFLTGKGINKKGNGINRAGKGVVRAGYGNDNKMDF